MITMEQGALLTVKPNRFMQHMDVQVPMKQRFTKLHQEVTSNKAKKREMINMRIKRDMVIASILILISAITMRWPTNHIFSMVRKAYLKLRMKRLILAEITVAKVARRRVKVASRLGLRVRCHKLRFSSHKRIYTELLMRASTLSNRAQLRIRLEHRQRNR